MNIREDLKRYLESSGLTVNALATQCGIPQPTLWRLLNKQDGCHSTTLEKLWPVLYGPGSPLAEPNQEKQEPAACRT